MVMSNKKQIIEAEAYEKFMKFYEMMKEQFPDSKRTVWLYKDNKRHGFNFHTKEGHVLCYVSFSTKENSDYYFSVQYPGMNGTERVDKNSSLVCIVHKIIRIDIKRQLGN